MAPSRTVIVAGAGIGGLTAALTLAQAGFRVTLLEQSERLEETGAGIQLSPNATRILFALGLEDRLRADAVAPDAVEIRAASGRLLARIPLGETATKRYGAPYWVTHRGDLQAALLEAVRGHPDIALKLGTRVEDVVWHGHGVSVACRKGASTADERGIALIGADGLWSPLRTRLGHRTPPVFGNRTAWRALVPADKVAPDFRTDTVQLWLGRDAHLVHYPVKAGTLINIVAIVDDQWAQPGWGADGARDDILGYLSRRHFAEPARELIALPERWQKWALYDLPPLRHVSDGPLTLLGDAAHPMLPFMAQGAAMAIEDAAVLATCMAREADNPSAGMRRYEASRRKRTAKAQGTARRNSKTYHLAGAEALARDLVMRLLGGKMLLRRFDWLYAWRPAPLPPK